jgi:catechol 2,3-dioxygenase-like lactoylglutathione lyase family enzyme
MGMGADNLSRPPIKENTTMRFKSQTRWMLVLLTLVLAMGATGRTQAIAANRAPAIQAVAAISTTVANMDRSVAFYAGTLSFEKVSDREMESANPASGNPMTRCLRVVTMRLGDETIELIQFKGRHGQPIPEDSRSNDFWFQHIAIIVSDMDRAYAVLMAKHVQSASVSPQRLPDWNKNAAGIRAFYFKDPDGHPLEILQFPEGKGDPKWHRNSGKLFLGIDHTAIVVDNTDASLKFYHDLLGMRIIGESENYGPEQERLNNVPGARLRITSLRADKGPGIELLEYLSPRNGRKLPYRPETSDLVHRHTLLIATDLVALAKALQTATNHEPPITERSTLAVRDPDGHELRIRTADGDTTIGELR